SSSESVTVGALGGGPRSDQDAQAARSSVGLPSTDDASTKSPPARNGSRETNRSATYAKRPTASAPAVSAPPNRPVGPSFWKTGIQKCGRSDGHMVEPVSRCATAGPEASGR